MRSFQIKPRDKEAVQRNHHGQRNTGADHPPVMVTPSKQHIGISGGQQHHGLAAKCEHLVTDSLCYLQKAFFFPRLHTKESPSYSGKPKGWV